MKSYPRYSTQQIIIHWLTAFCVFITILLPFTKSFLANIFDGMGNVFMLHKSFGVMILLITCWRICINKKQGVPEVLSSNERLQQILSKSVQGIIYLALIILPVSGYLMGANAINFFNLFLIPAIDLPISVRSDFHSIHIIVAFVLILMVLLHAFAALYHHFWVKDDVLKSMLPKKWVK